jgi:PAS domain S-box-containing protein
MQMEEEQPKLSNKMSLSAQNGQNRMQESAVSESKYRAIFNQRFQCTGLVTLEGLVLEMNQSALDFNGLELADVVNRPLWETPCWKISQQTQDQLKQAIARAAEGEFISYQVELLGANNQIFMIDFSIRPLRNDADEILMLIIEGRDITKLQNLLQERNHLLQKEKAARKQAETANRIKDEFLAVLSHELRTPLNSILGWATLLKKGKLKPEQISEAVDIIDRNAKLQVHLIDNLLDMSRILKGQDILKISPVNLAVIILAVEKTLYLAAQTKEIQIQTIIEPNIGVVAGDIDRLQQIIWNLLSNAIKFTPHGGRVELRLEPVGSLAQITITDTGKGISPEFLPYIFDYFRQEDSSTSREFNGLGLGLGIVYNLVKLHGGTIKAHSCGLGQGTTFILKLPLINMPCQPETKNTVN